MKVIVKGALPEEELYQARCNHCSSVLEFMKKEVRWEHSQREGSYVEFQCPVCSRAAITTANKVVTIPKSHLHLPNDLIFKD